MPDQTKLELEEPEGTYLVPMEWNKNKIMQPVYSLRFLFSLYIQLDVI